MQVEFVCQEYEYTHASESPARLTLDFCGSRSNGFTGVTTILQKEEETAKPTTVKLDGGSKIRIHFDTESVRVFDDTGQTHILHETPSWRVLQINELQIRSIDGSFQMRYYSLSQSSDALTRLTAEEFPVVNVVREIQQQHIRNSLMVQLDPRFLASHRQKLESSLLAWRDNLGVCHPFFLRLMMERALCANASTGEEGLRRALVNDMMRLSNTMNLPLSRFVNVSFDEIAPTVALPSDFRKLAIESVKNGDYVTAQIYIETVVRACG